MKNKIKQRITELEIEVENLRTVLEIINYEILYRNLYISGYREIEINNYCLMGQRKLKEINTLIKLLD